EHMVSLDPGYNWKEGTKGDVAARTGTIVYFKPSVANGVSADVPQYSIENPVFPQQSTANQWFDEAQFESYRKLGQYCAGSAFDNGSGCAIGEKSALTSDDIKCLFETISAKARKCSSEAKTDHGST